MLHLAMLIVEGGGDTGLLDLTNWQPTLVSKSEVPGRHFEKGS